VIRVLDQDDRPRSFLLRRAAPDFAGLYDFAEVTEDGVVRPAAP
jgi:hypothetical protein